MFKGFGPAAFSFLAELRDNNDPAWFKPRKAVYEAEVLGPLKDLVAALTQAIAEAGLPLRGDPKGAVFRIHRDVRFAKDKRPYKTHAGAVLTRSGAKWDPGLLYVHVEPGACMLAAGFWHPEPDLLAGFRRAMLREADAFLALAQRLADAGLPLRSDERLARLPRGFEAAKGAPIAEYLTWRNLTTRLPLADAEMATPDVVERGVGFLRAVLPLLAFGWQVADQTAPTTAPPPAARVRPLHPPDF